MKKQITLLLLLLSASVLLLAGFSNDNHKTLQVAKSVATSKAKPEKVSITMSFTTLVDGVWQGTFTTSGSNALPASGTCTMAAEARGKNGIHCVNTVITEEGTLTINSYCTFSTNPSKGQWHIVSGTGAYADLKGNGSLLMPMSETPIEAFTGRLY